MDVYRTEEEQVAAIKDWWRRNGVAVVVAAALAIGTFLGWKYWQHLQVEKGREAAQLYQTLMQSYQQVVTGAPESADAAVRMEQAGTQLIGEYGESIYARFAGLVLAGRAVEQDDYAVAEKHLRAVVAIDAEDGLGVIATHRLARVLSAQGRHDDALALVAAESPKGFEVARDDLRGDILLAQGKRADARAAWEKALAAAEERDPARGLIDMKLAYVAGE